MTNDRLLKKSLGKIGEVFLGGFDALRDSQRAAIPSILAGHNVLLACPTASGKTEAIIAPLLASIDKRDTKAPGVALIAVAPTRALVNDLHARLSPKLEVLGLKCGRQTSDHRAGKKLPDVLITTPESLDSLLARRTVFDRDGSISGHELESIRGLFIDEAHLFDNSARGDQLLWLIARLRRIIGFATDNGRTSGGLQICAASASVSEPEKLAKRLLDDEAKIISVGGSREMQLYDGQRSGRWMTIDPTLTSSDLQVMIPVYANESEPEFVARIIISAMKVERDLRKVLIFVPSRRQCDTLSAYLKKAFDIRHGVSILAHHGSLERGFRESAEDQFDSARDAILVATSTLEVGVDIGDVDAVLLVGPPTDTNALLQRVGRAGRRSGVTKIIAIAKSLMDRAAIGSMLVSARDGRFDSLPYGMRWSVAVQQISSFVKQGTSQGRRIDDLLDLAEKVVPNGGRGKARSIIDHLLVEGCLESTKHQRVVFGEPWTELWEGMGMHGNIDSGGHGVPVVDSVTGDTIAHIPHKAGLTERVSIGGSDWKVIKSDGEILLEPDKKSKGSDGVRYGSRKAPVGRNFARHVARGYGLDECETPLVTFRGRNFMFHFGGSAYEKMLMNLHHGFERANGLSGIAVCGDFGPSVLAEILETKSFTSIVDSRLDELATVLMPGPYHRMLPDGIRHHTLSELFGPEEFKCWLGSRVLRRVERDDPLHSELVQALEETFID